MRAPVFILALTTAIAAAPLLAQDPVLPPAPSKGAAAPAGETIDLALANRLTVPVSVDAKGPYSFVVDTGAERSVVSRELAEQLNLARGNSARIFDFVGVSTVDTARVPSLSSGTLGTSALEAPLLAEANLGAAGLLGIDALQGHKVVIDFDANRMTVVPAKRHADGDIVVRAQARLGQLIVTRASFNGKPISVVVDTGSWLTIGNSAMLKLARPKPRMLGSISVESVTGRSFDTNYVAVSGIRVGEVNFDDFPMSFADVPPFERFGLKDTPALILGMSSLKLFRRVEIDFANREIAFTLPRPKFDFHNTCRGYAACKSL